MGILENMIPGGSGCDGCGLRRCEGCAVFKNFNEHYDGKKAKDCIRYLKSFSCRGDKIFNSVDKIGKYKIDKK